MDRRPTQQMQARRTQPGNRTSSQIEDQELENNVQMMEEGIDEIS